MARQSKRKPWSGPSTFRVRHNGQRLMAWAVGNARMKPRGNAIIFTKQAAATSMARATASLSHRAAGSGKQGEFAYSVVPQ